MKKKLLVVDDDPWIRRLILRSLQSDEYEIIEEADGDVAVERVRREKPAVVILDMHMPRLDGLAALTGILEVSPSTRVLVMTGDPSLVLLAQERGACECVTKPVDVAVLKTRVADLFQSAFWRRA